LNSSGFIVSTLLGIVSHYNNNNLNFSLDASALFDWSAAVIRFAASTEATSVKAHYASGASGEMHFLLAGREAKKRARAIF
jgi:hypothetical protein